jgi:hypothetical protein
VVAAGGVATRKAPVQRHHPNGPVVIPGARINALDAAFSAALDHHANARDHEASVIMLTAVGDFLDGVTRLAEPPGRNLPDEPLAIGILNAFLWTFSAAAVVLLILAALGVVC